MHYTLSHVKPQIIAFTMISFNIQFAIKDSIPRSKSEFATKLGRDGCPVSLQGAWVMNNSYRRSRFSYSEKRYAEAPLLRHPIPVAQLSLWVEASDIAIGGTLFQSSQEKWESIAFFSMKLNKSQQKWSR
ncbi:transposon Ty3-I Gag-Pol polyprotein [Trichonephila clavipes]|nr:transposon Ty3-I Gag-Pol polyprotein [Trichonephila clavipes]